VAQRTFQHVADDFHVAVAVFAEAAAGGHAILVDHAQRTPVDVLVVEIAREGEAVPRVQPAVVGVAASGGGAQGDHGGAPVCGEACSMIIDTNGIKPTKTNRSFH
jgi:hypothetical protein